MLAATQSRAEPLECSAIPGTGATVDHSVDRYSSVDRPPPFIMAGRALTLLFALLPAATSAYSNTHPVLAWSSRKCVTQCAHRFP